MQVYARIRADASDEQLVYYDQGVGTDPSEAIRGGAIGTGLSREVLAGYLWLMENYRPAHESPAGVADDVFIFGEHRQLFAPSICVVPYEPFYVIVVFKVL